MKSINDIKIVGIDELRPPYVRKEPYIDLYFKLSHQAPKTWCTQFNELVAKSTYSVKLDPKEGLFIETWVRQPDEIEMALSSLKEIVKNTTYNYIAKARAKQDSNTVEQGAIVSKEQAHLDSIISGLKFDDD